MSIRPCIALALASSVGIFSLVAGPPTTCAQTVPVNVPVSDGVGSAWDPVIAGLPSPSLASGAMADLFVAYTSSENFTANCLTGASFTNDGGKTWSKSRFTCLPAGSTDFDLGQPATAYDPVAGQIYLVTNRLSAGLVPTLYIQTSTDGGATFGPPVTVVSGASGHLLQRPVRHSRGLRSRLRYSGKHLCRLLAVFILR